MDPALLEIIDGLDTEDLFTLCAELRAILQQRDRAAANSLINWHGMSSFELSGVLCAARIALARAILRTDASQAAAILQATPLTLQ